VTVLLDPGAEALDLDLAIRAYRARGFARVGRVASDEVLTELRSRADQMMLGRLDYEGLFFQKDSDSNNYDDLEYGKGWQGPTLNYRKIEKLEKDPVYWAFLNNPVFARVAHAVIGDQVSIYRAFIMNKSSQGGSNLPWHQDGGRFWGLDRPPELQIWTALDDAPEEAGCVEFLPGTHTAGLATPLGGVVPAEHVAARGEADLVLMPARAGDVLLIHNHVWHRSGLNRTGRPRRAFSVCYMSADTKCVRKKRAPRTFVRVFNKPDGSS
jgi:phytanoyl-CoA hydroxylase